MNVKYVMESGYHDLGMIAATIDMKIKSFRGSLHDKHGCFDRRKGTGISVLVLFRIRMRTQNSGGRDALPRIVDILRTHPS